jgi:putative ABC transport system substrate-binding protein
MKRRRFLALTGATLALPARAQAGPRIGFLVAGDPEPAWTLFRKSMAELGYVEGRSVTYVYRAGDADRGALDRLAAELVASGVDVIVTSLTPAMTAAAAATTKIPIVFDSAAPEAANVKNIAHPGGNLTGVYSPSSTIAGKCLQLLHQAKTGAKSFGLMMNMRDPFHVPMQRDVATAARAEKVDCAMIEVQSPDRLAAAFDSAIASKLDGVVIQPSLGMKNAAQLALDHGMPSISFRRSFVEYGGLMSYGIQVAEIYRSMAGQVQQILKGAPLADVPVQVAALFELVANRRTAKTLGLVFPPLFLASVDEMIG